MLIFGWIINITRLNKRVIIVLVSTFMKGIFAFGASGSTLNFQPSLNKFRVLNQKLEFHLIDEDSLRLGHQLLTNSGMKLELVGSRENPVIRFTGPKQFMKSSQIIIRDPSGKALWKKEALGLKMQTKKVPTSFEGVRNDLRIYEEVDDATTVLALASESVFFNFCLFHENETRRFNICSADYNVSKVEEGWVLKNVKGNEQENRFMVNGVEVGSEGEIQFSKEITSLSLSAKLLSGLLVEIKTREVPLTLVDYEYQQDKPFLNLRVRENTADSFADETREWQSKIQLKKPFFYIEAENQISLKQEIVIEGGLLADNEKPKIIFPQGKTYSSTVNLEIENSESDILRPLNKGDLIQSAKGFSIWTIKNLKQNQLSNRRVELKNAKGKHPFVGSFEVLRGQPAEASVFTDYSEYSNSVTSNKVLHSGLGLGIKYYFTDFLFLRSAPWNHLRWGVFADVLADQYSQEEQRLQQTISSVELIYRLQSGLHTVDPAFSFGLGYQSRSRPPMSQSGASLSFNYLHPVANWGILGDRIGLRFKIFPAMTDNKKITKSGSIWEASWESKYRLSSIGFEWSWALKNESERLIRSGTDVPITGSSLGFAMGLNKIF